VIVNYDDALAQVRAAGLLVEGLEPDRARPKRCKVDGRTGTPGWYWLHTICRGEDELLVGGYGVWSGNDNGAQQVQLAKDQRQQLTAEQRQAIAERQRADRKRLEAQRRREQERAAARAEKVWRESLHEAPAGCDYLTRKGIGAHGVRYTASGAVVLAMHDGSGRVHGLQFILSRSGHRERIRRTGRDKEYWPPGLAKQGHWFQIGAPSRVLVIAEGYATGASIHEATGHAVAVAFDAGNLLPVAKACRRRYPHAKVLIAADDDFATKGNPGVNAASAAALAVDGGWVAPVFADQRQVEARRRCAEIPQDLEHKVFKARAKAVLDEVGTAKATDFNDLHAAEGLNSVRAQIEARVSALGWDVAPRESSTSGGRGGDAAKYPRDIEDLLRDFTLIYGTEAAFDAANAMVLGLAPLSHAVGRDVTRAWKEHPDRKTCLQSEVGFDPTESDPAIKCNIWRGWETAPKPGECTRLLDLLRVLCGNEHNEDELYHWVLRWLAYPLQHPGTKMQTAILMHGPEGAGKNLFFEQIRQIYGRYGAQFGQTQLEDKYNGWASGMLFGIGNEVLTRADVYNLQGKLKQMVTDEVWTIRELYTPSRQEHNRCNFVFFSNRVDIAKLDPDDRRYCVIYTPGAMSASFYQAVGAEARNGGREALHDYLLHLDLGDFGPHSKPPATQAKADLIDLSMDSTERFWRDWLAGDLAPLAVCPCATEDLYSAYVAWGRREGLTRVASKQTLLTVIGKKPGVLKRQERIEAAGVLQKKTVLYPPFTEIPSEGLRYWLGDKIGDFRASLRAYQEDFLQ
jgi:putative DNA primase/helicase